MCADGETRARMLATLKQELAQAREERRIRRAAGLPEREAWRPTGAQAAVAVALLAVAGLALSA